MPVVERVGVGAEGDQHPCHVDPVVGGGEQQRRPAALVPRLEGGAGAQRQRHLVGVAGSGRARAASGPAAAGGARRPRPRAGEAMASYPWTGVIRAAVTPSRRGGSRRPPRRRRALGRCRRSAALPSPRMTASCRAVQPEVVDVVDRTPARTVGRRRPSGRARPPGSGRCRRSCPGSRRRHRGAGSARAARRSPRSRDQEGALLGGVLGVDVGAAAISRRACTTSSSQAAAIRRRSSAYLLGGVGRGAHGWLLGGAGRAGPVRGGGGGGRVRRRGARLLARGAVGGRHAAPGQGQHGADRDDCGPVAGWAGRHSVSEGGEGVVYQDGIPRVGRG